MMFLFYDLFTLFSLEIIVILALLVYVVKAEKRRDADNPKIDAAR
jgi:hypothetical protein